MTRPATARSYNRWATDYDRRWRHYTDVTLGVLLDHLALDRDRAVLDVGCGTGTLLARLRNRVSHARLIGVDPSDGMLRLAREKLADEAVDLYDGTAYQLPLNDQSVDVVTMANMVHYLTRPSVACNEARRVLRPGGALAIVDYVIRGGRGSVIDGLIRLYDRGHVRVHDTRELRAILDAAGLHVTHASRFPIDCIFAGVLVIGEVPAAA